MNDQQSVTYAAIERTFHQESGQTLATLIGWLGDFERAEDALHDALVAALEHWTRAGIPTRPGAWLTLVARRKAIDRLRRDRTALGQVGLAMVESTLAAELDDLDTDDAIPDERLKLMFICCHPALPLEAQVALTLHTLGGLCTAEIARAFLVPLPTMAQRLVRAKRKIKDAGIPYAVPPVECVGERIDAVLHVLYLIFTEGYAAREGDLLIRYDLCDEAIRLCRTLTLLVSRNGIAVPAPQHAEVLGLLSLMLLHHSRRQARLSSTGEFVLLSKQNRALWNRTHINTGVGLLEKALHMGYPGPYQIQAAISALHAEAVDADATDWPQITLLYAELLKRGRTPVIELNYAVALGMASGPDAGLAVLARLAEEGALANYHPFHMARADLLRRAGRYEDAQSSYVTAFDLCHNHVERTALLRCLTDLSQAMLPEFPIVDPSGV